MDLRLMIQELEYRSRLQPWWRFIAITSIVAILAVIVCQKLDWPDSAYFGIALSGGAVGFFDAVIYRRNKN